ncbi:helix-turn-helix domain-containing protein [Corynebacterium glyciniphilum]|uniref:helix-turn-helix domain-containing protein n=1 Tax=Corynebacterium glyciniphilum TaxID=1404244 RepID=UPI0011AB49A0|nr:helix-turn-helix domain-containing protein [Corynebacterium glyciniphilum]
MPKYMSAPVEDSITAEPWVSVATAAEHFEVSTRTVHRLIAAGRVPVMKLGRATRVRLSDIEATATVLPVIDL